MTELLEAGDVCWCFFFSTLPLSLCEKNYSSLLCTRTLLPSHLLYRPGSQEEDGSAVLNFLLMRQFEKAGVWREQTLCGWAWRQDFSASFLPLSCPPSHLSGILCIPRRAGEGKTLSSLPYLLPTLPAPQPSTLLPPPIAGSPSTFSPGHQQALHFRNTSWHEQHFSYHACNLPFVLWTPLYLGKGRKGSSSTCHHLPGKAHLSAPFAPGGGRRRKEEEGRKKRGKERQGLTAHLPAFKPSLSYSVWLVNHISPYNRRTRKRTRAVRQARRKELISLCLCTHAWHGQFWPAYLQLHSLQWHACLF